MSSSELMFSKCCFFIPLRIGCFILGYLGVVVHTILLTASVAGTAFIGLASHGFTHFDNPKLSHIDKPVLTFLSVLLAVVIVINLVWLAANIFCLVGIHKKKPGPIRVYVALSVVRILLTGTGLCLYLAKKVVDPFAFSVHVLELSLAIYFTLVYYVYAKQLKREQDGAKQADPAFIYPTKIDKEFLVKA